jgi:hypothetical protein
MDNVIDFDARKPKAAKSQDQKPSPAMLEKIGLLAEAFGAIGGIAEMDDDGNASVKFFGPDGLVGLALVIADTRVIQ